MKTWGEKAFANAPLLLTLAALFWAGNSVLARGMHETIPPVALAFTRWTFATLIVLPFAWRHLRDDWPVLRTNWRIMAFLGLFGAASYNTLHYIGLNYTPAVNALVIGASTPLLVALVSFAAFGDRLTRTEAAGIALALAGTLAVVSRGAPATLMSANFNIGDLWIVAAISAWAVYTAYLRRKPAIHWLSFAAVTYALASLYNLPLFLAEHFLDRQLRADLPTALAITYVSIFPSVLAYIFFTRGVELIGGNRASVFIYLMPVFGALLSIALLGETLQLYHIGGFGLIMAGVAIANHRAS